MKALVGVIMGSSSDWETMQAAADTLTRLGIAHEVRVISAHRTPDLLFVQRPGLKRSHPDNREVGLGGQARVYS